MNKEKLRKDFEIILFNDFNIDVNNINDVYDTLESIFRKKKYLENFNTVKNNWLELPVKEVTECILNFIKELELVEV